MKSLIFSRHFIEQGQLWRLISGHFVHLGLTHLLINLAGIGLIIMINKSFVFSAKGALSTLALCLWVSAALWLFNPDLSRYVGFSGVLHGLFPLAVTLQPLFSRGEKAFLILVCVIKILAEQTGLYDTSALNINIGGKVMVDAHFYGLTGGLTLLLTFLMETSLFKYLKQGIKNSDSQIQSSED